MPEANSELVQRLYSGLMYYESIGVNLDFERVQEYVYEECIVRPLAKGEPTVTEAQFEALTEQVWARVQATA
jgi:hypothetical protein